VRKEALLALVSHLLHGALELGLLHRDNLYKIDYPTFAQITPVQTQMLHWQDPYPHPALYHAKQGRHPKIPEALQKELDRSPEWSELWKLPVKYRCVLIFFALVDLAVVGTALYAGIHDRQIGTACMLGLLALLLFWFNVAFTMEEITIERKRVWKEHHAHDQPSHNSQHQPQQDASWV
jgi:hypothetical protein